MSKTSLIIVLLEDDHHKMFIYRYLTKFGVSPWAIRIVRSPSGAGSAESWVRKQFVVETSRYRSRQARTALIVMIDADNCMSAIIQNRLFLDRGRGGQHHRAAGASHHLIISRGGRGVF